MRMFAVRCALCCLAVIGVVGCRTTSVQPAAWSETPTPVAVKTSVPDTPVSSPIKGTPVEQRPSIQLVSFQDETAPTLPGDDDAAVDDEELDLLDLPSPDEETDGDDESDDADKEKDEDDTDDKRETPRVPDPFASLDAGTPPTLAAVIDSVYATYPLLRASLTERQRAAGQQLEAYGGYDHLLDGESRNQGVSFYENFRHRATVSRNIYRGGGNWFANYKLGRGEFEPWYRERETNEGGEFKFGLLRPLRQGRDIDARRAALWRATYERARVEPAIQAELIDYVLSASVAYWTWAAAGQSYELADDLLGVAETRTDQIRRLVELEFLPPQNIPENERLVLVRQAARLEAERALRQATAQLAAFYRTVNGVPILVDSGARVGFLPLENPTPDIEADLPGAAVRRPMMRQLLVKRQQQNVTLAKAGNDLLPRIDAAAEARQDVGGAASDPDTKEDFELQASLFVNVPLERRAAKGRVLQAQSAIADTTARLQLAQDRVRIDLEVAAAAIETSIARIEAARESLELSKELVRVERRLFELDRSSLLEVTLREQQLLDSATALINAHRDAHIAEANYRAALAIDRLPDTPPPGAPAPFCPPKSHCNWRE